MIYWQFDFSDALQLSRATDTFELFNYEILLSATKANTPIARRTDEMVKSNEKLKNQETPKINRIIVWGECGLILLQNGQ